MSTYELPPLSSSDGVNKDKGCKILVIFFVTSFYKTKIKILYNWNVKHQWTLIQIKFSQISENFNFSDLAGKISSSSVHFLYLFEFPIISI